MLASPRRYRRAEQKAGDGPAGPLGREACRPTGRNPLIFMAWLRALNKRLYEPALGRFVRANIGAPQPLATEGVLTSHQHWCGDGGCPVAPAGRRSKDALDGTRQAIWQRHGRLALGHRTCRRCSPIPDLQHRLPILESDLRPAAAGRRQRRTRSRPAPSCFGDPDGPYTDLHGPALRAIYDLSDLDKSVFLTALGQSAHVLSPHYDDLLPRWRAFDWLRLPRDAARRNPDPGTRPNHDDEARAAHPRRHPGRGLA